MLTNTYTIALINKKKIERKQLHPINILCK